MSPITVIAVRGLPCASYLWKILLYNMTLMVDLSYLCVLWLVDFSTSEMLNAVLKYIHINIVHCALFTWSIVFSCYFWILGISCP